MDAHLEQNYKEGEKESCAYIFWEERVGGKDGGSE